MKLPQLKALKEAGMKTLHGLTFLLKIPGSFVKSVAAVTCACFLYTSVLSQALYALAEPQAEVVKVKATLDEPIISLSCGRITDATLFDSRQIVINIQDLHCHPEIQRNIAKILESLDRKYGLKNVYVEGGYGNIDTSWICNIRDIKAKNEILENLLDQGRLTGSEYYSAISNRPYLLKGIEDEAIHKANIVRLGKILERKSFFEQKIGEMDRELKFMQAKYCSSRTKKLNKLIEEHKAGKIPAEKYYSRLAKYVETINKNPAEFNALLSLRLEDYPNIQTYLELTHTGKHLNYNRISRQMQGFAGLMKQKLPYQTYRTLFDTAGDAASSELQWNLARTAQTPAIEAECRGAYPELYAYFRYMEMNQALNPTKLLEEERRLAEEIRTRLARDISELEVSFLAESYGYFKDYMANRITADDYLYFRQKFGKFQSVWNKYAFNSPLSELAKDFDVLDEFYETNLSRNGCFLKHIDLAGGPRSEERGGSSVAESLKEAQIIVLVTGGFHTEGLKGLLRDRNVSCITVTPNVTRDASASASMYAALAEQQSRLFGSQALALALGSQDAKIVSATNDRVVIALNGAIVTLTKNRKNGRYEVAGDVRKIVAFAGTVTDKSAIENGVRQALEIADRMRMFANPLLSSELLYQLVKSFELRAGFQGIFGGSGLIWSIASDPEVQRIISRRENITPGEINCIPEFAQELIRGHAVDLEEIADRAASPLTVAMVQAVANHAVALKAIGIYENTVFPRLFGAVADYERHAVRPEVIISSLDQLSADEMRSIFLQGFQSGRVRFNTHYDTLTKSAGEDRLAVVSAVVLRKVNEEWCFLVARKSGTQIQGHDQYALPMATMDHPAGKKYEDFAKDAQWITDPGDFGASKENVMAGTAKELMEDFGIDVAKDGGFCARLDGTSDAVSGVSIQSFVYVDKDAAASLPAAKGEKRMSAPQWVPLSLILENSNENLHASVLEWLKEKKGDPSAVLLTGSDQLGKLRSVFYQVFEQQSKMYDFEFGAEGFITALRFFEPRADIERLQSSLSKTSGIRKTIWDDGVLTIYTENEVIKIHEKGTIINERLGLKDRIFLKLGDKDLVVKVYKKDLRDTRKPGQPVYILGVCRYGHDSGAVLLKDGRIIGAIEEERLNRDKHAREYFPVESVKHLLKEHAISWSDIAHIALTFDYNYFRHTPHSSSPRDSFYHKVGWVGSSKGEYDTETLEKYLNDLATYFKTRYVPPVTFVKHHKAHAVSAWHTSPFNDKPALIFSIDGRGEDDCTTIWKAERGKLKKVAGTLHPDSLGQIYEYTTVYIGFKRFDEGKVMGLAPYGAPEYSSDAQQRVEEQQRVNELRKVISGLIVFDERAGVFKLNRNYMDYSHYQLDRPGFSAAFVEKIRELVPPLKPGEGGSLLDPDRKEYRPYFNFAFVMQEKIEQTIMQMVKHHKELSSFEYVVMCGGLALNITTNGKIISSKLVDSSKLYVPAFPGDDGTPVGAALSVAEEEYGLDSRGEIKSVSLGRTYSDAEIESVLRKFGLVEGRDYERALSQRNLIARTAEYLEKKMTVAWFQGGSELGPRALGNRSILHLLTDPEGNKKVNVIKGREWWRPSALSIIEEEAAQYLENIARAPFMTIGFDIILGKQGLIVSGKHPYAGDARPQTVAKEALPLYWELLNEVGRRTGVSGLLNTSFNRQEPIVETPEEAVNTLYYSKGIDYLVAGSFIIHKNEKLLPSVIAVMDEPLLKDVFRNALSDNARDEDWNVFWSTLDLFVQKRKSFCHTVTLRLNDDFETQVVVPLTKEIFGKKYAGQMVASLARMLIMKSGQHQNGHHAISIECTAPNYQSVIRGLFRKLLAGKYSFTFREDYEPIMHIGYREQRQLTDGSGVAPSGDEPPALGVAVRSVVAGAFRQAGIAQAMELADAVAETVSADKRLPALREALSVAEAKHFEASEKALAQLAAVRKVATCRGEGPARSMYISPGVYGFATTGERSEILVSEGFWEHFKTDAEQGAILRHEQNERHWLRSRNIGGEKATFEDYHAFVKEQAAAGSNPGLPEECAVIEKVEKILASAIINHKFEMTDKVAGLIPGVTLAATTVSGLVESVRLNGRQDVSDPYLQKVIDFVFIHLTSARYSDAVWTPVGLYSIIGYLRHVFPFVTSHLYDTQTMTAEECAKMVDQIVEIRPKVVGFSVPPGTTQPLARFMRQLSERLPAEDMPLVVLGKSIPTFNAESLLTKYPSAICVIGEGELAVHDLVEYANGIRKLADVRNIAYSENGGIVYTKRERITDLQEYMRPDYSHISKIVKLGGNISLEYGRGCPWGKCTFCSVHQFWGNPISLWVHRPKENVIADIRQLYSLGVRSINFSDEEFLGNTRKDVERVMAFARLLKKENLQGLKIQFNARVDAVVVDDPQLQKLVEHELDALAGCGFKTAFLGVESGSVSQLKRYGKGVIPDKAQKAFEILRRHNLQIQSGFIMFDPLVTKQELRENALFIKNSGILPSVSAPLNPIRIYKGTPYERMLHNWERKHNDTVLGELDHDTMEYKVLKYVHPEVRDMFALCNEYFNSYYEFYYQLKQVANFSYYGVKTSYLSDYLYRFKMIEIELLLELTSLNSEDFASKKGQSVLVEKYRERRRLLDALEKDIAANNQEKELDTLKRKARAVTETVPAGLVPSNSKADRIQIRQYIDAIETKRGGKERITISNRRPIADGVIVSDLVLNDEDTFAKGEVHYVTPETVDFELLSDGRVLDRDLISDPLVDNDPRAGYTIQEWVQKAKDSSKVVAGFNLSQADGFLTNSLSIEEGRLATRFQGKRGLMQKEYAAPSGVFYIFSLDADKKGIYEIELDDEGRVKQDIHIHNGFAGVPLLMKGTAFPLDKIKFETPCLDGLTLDWSDGLNKRQAFSAYGYNRNKELVIVSLSGYPNGARKEPVLTDMVDVLKELGVTDAVLAGTAADVQRYHGYGKAADVLFAGSRQGSTLQRRTGTSWGQRRICQALVVKSKSFADENTNGELTAVLTERHSKDKEQLKLRLSKNLSRFKSTLSLVCHNGKWTSAAIKENILPDEYVEMLVRQAAKDGHKAIEIGADVVVGSPNHPLLNERIGLLHQKASEIAKLARHYNIDINIHEFCFFFRDSAGVIRFPEPAKDKDLFEQWLLVGKEMGAKVAVVHLTDARSEESLLGIIDFIKFAAKHHIVIGLENTHFAIDISDPDNIHPYDRTHTFEDFAYAVNYIAGHLDQEEKKYFGITFDIPKAYYAGSLKSTSLGSDPLVYYREIMELVKDRGLALVNVHLGQTGGGKYNKLPLYEEGVLPVEEVLDTLYRDGYRGYVNQETHGDVVPANMARPNSSEPDLVKGESALGKSAKSVDEAAPINVSSVLLPDSIRGKGQANEIAKDGVATVTEWTDEARAAIGVAWRLPWKFVHSFIMSIKTIADDQDKTGAAPAVIDWHYISSSNLVHAVNEFGAASTDNTGQIHANIYLVDQITKERENWNWRNTGLNIEGSPVWVSAHNGAVVMCASNENIDAIADAVNETITDKGSVTGSREIAERLKELFVSASIALKASDFKPGIVIDHTTNGKKVRYDENGTMIVDGDFFWGEDGKVDRAALPAKLGELVSIRNGESVAMGRNMLLYMDDGFDPETNVETLFCLKGQQIVVDGVSKAKAVQDKLGEIQKQRHIKLQIRVFARVNGQADVATCIRNGLAGCMVDSAGRLELFDFSYSKNEGIPVEMVAGKNAEEIKTALRKVQSPCCMIKVSGIAEALVNDRDIIEKVGLTQLLGDGVLAFFGMHVYSERYVRNVVYAADGSNYDDPQFMGDYLRLMRDRLEKKWGDNWLQGGTAEYTRLERAYREAVKERALAEEWIQTRKHGFVMPLTHKQMLGKALALKQVAGAGESVAFDASDLSEAGINRAYQAIAEIPRAQAIDEFIAMLELFDMQALDGKQLMVPQTDVHSIAAILKAA